MFFPRSAALLTLVAAGAGYAQSINSLSTQCQATLASLVVSSENACLNPTDLVSIVTAGANDSLVQPINNWLSGMCAQPQCTNQTLSDIVSNVTTGCASDLQSLGAGDVNAEEITNIVQMAYPTVRKVACLKDTSNDTLCLTQTLTNVQSSIGTLSKSEIQQLVSQISAGQIPSIPSSAYCTDCDKEALNIAKTDFPDLFNSNVQSAVSGQCSADFVDGATPSGVQQTANTATASANGLVNNGATMGQMPVGIAISAILTLSSAFAFLA
ncbi:hypothetical protein QCA50_004550 [Cerrena zonata]|uniref:Uncharacterized protein n=1 Tax=Cerrena zonata TaxID=2478898 RepID=A0AAW0GLV5_9APHY